MPSETTSVTGVSTEPSDVVSGEMPEGSSSREVMAKRGSTALGSWLVAIDLDGTTIDEAGDASRGMVTQLRRIERVGHHLLIATGRSAATTLPVLDRIGAWPEYVVCSNGAVILQRDGAAPSGYHRLHTAGFDPSAVLAAVCANLPEARIAVEDEAGVYRYTHPFPPATTEAAEEQVIVPFEALLDGRAVRVVARGAKTSSSGRLAEVLRQVEPETESGPAYADPSTENQQQMTADLISGDGQAGEALLDHAARQGQVTGQQGSDLLYRARVLAKQARLLIMRGEPGQARQLIGPALKLFEAEGSEQKAAAWGCIADIALEQGEYDEALRIHLEVVPPVYERLGDARSVAVAWGRITDIAYQRGEFDEAAELQSQRLQVNRQLGDLNEIAAANFPLAQIDLAREHHDQAVRRLAESFSIVSQLQRSDGSAAVGWALGQLLVAAGQEDQAR